MPLVLFQKVNSYFIIYNPCHISGLFGNSCQYVGVQSLVNAVFNLGNFKGVNIRKKKVCVFVT